jgi:hypothetical protein
MYIVVTFDGKDVVMIVTLVTVVFRTVVALTVLKIDV